MLAGSDEKLSITYAQVLNLLRQSAVIETLSNGQTDRQRTAQKHQGSRVVSTFELVATSSSLYNIENLVRIFFVTDSDSKIIFKTYGEDLGHEFVELDLFVEQIAVSLPRGAVHALVHRFVFEVEVPDALAHVLLFLLVHVQNGDLELQSGRGRSRQN